MSTWEDYYGPNDGVTEIIWYEFESIEGITETLEELTTEVLALETQCPVLFPASVKGCRLSLELAGAAIQGKEAEIQVAFRNYWRSQWWDCFAEGLSKKAYEYRASGPVELEPGEILENFPYFQQHKQGLVNKIKGVWMGTNAFHPERFEGQVGFFEEHLVGLSFEMAFHLLAGHPDNVAEGLRVVWGYESRYR
jgi:hypothetical protein